MPSNTENVHSPHPGEGCRPGGDGRRGGRCAAGRRHAAKAGVLALEAVHVLLLVPLGRCRRLQLRLMLLVGA